MVIQMRWMVAGCLAVVINLPARAAIRLASFDVDVTPPVGSRLTYDPMKAVGELSLRGRGIVLTGAGAPIVLCAVDWIGIGNEAHDVFRQALAEAAGTGRDRVAVHALHQHDAPMCDFSAEKLLLDHDAAPQVFESTFARTAIVRAAAAVREAVASGGSEVSHVGWGRAEVREVASSRRILGPDGKIKAMRMTACKDPAIRAEPEGTIDPWVMVVGFWDGHRPLAVLSYYASHPQSFYRTGVANPDFPGVARFLRDQALPGVRHIHFNGAGGNVGAGKYNDGAPANRPVLAARLADGLARAWAAVQKSPLAPEEVGWKIEPVALPPAPHLDEGTLTAALSGESANASIILGAAQQLAWLRRCRAGHRIELSCLRLGPVRVLHMPGELFVEYQLAAQKMRVDEPVAMAAYGDYGPGYIGTEVAYAQGGYETQPTSSFVAPQVEKVLLDGMRTLLAD